MFEPNLQKFRYGGKLSNINLINDRDIQMMGYEKIPEYNDPDREKDPPKIIMCTLDCGKTSPIISNKNNKPDSQYVCNIRPYVPYQEKNVTFAGSCLRKTDKNNNTGDCECPKGPYSCAVGGDD